MIFCVSGTAVFPNALLLLRGASITMRADPNKGIFRMSDAFICDAIRTPVGRYGGGLSKVRTDDLGAVPIRALMDRNESVDWEEVDDVYYGSANQAGEDNRNVARMSGLLAGLPLEVGGATVNRLCGSGMEATVRRVPGRSASARLIWSSPAGSRACRGRRS